MNNDLIKQQDKLKRDNSNVKSFWLPNEYQDMLVAICKAENRNLSNAVQCAIKKYYEEVVR
jgi:hypothetical protein